MIRSGSNPALARLRSHTQKQSVKQSGNAASLVSPKNHTTPVSMNVVRGEKSGNNDLLLLETTPGAPTSVTSKGVTMWEDEKKGPSSSLPIVEHRSPPASASDEILPPPLLQATSQVITPVPAPSRPSTTTSRLSPTAAAAAASILPQQLSMTPPQASTSLSAAPASLIGERTNEKGEMILVMHWQSVCTKKDESTESETPTAKQLPFRSCRLNLIVPTSQVSPQVSPQVSGGEDKEAFPVTMHRMLAYESQKNSQYVHWSEDGTAFFISNHQMDPTFGQLISRYFYHGNWESLRRQLNAYQFKKINDKESELNGYWQHANFHRDADTEGLLAVIAKKKEKSLLGKSTQRSRVKKNKCGAKGQKVGKGETKGKKRKNRSDDAAASETGSLKVNKADKKQPASKHPGSPPPAFLPVKEPRGGKKKDHKAARVEKTPKRTIPVPLNVEKMMSSVVNNGVNSGVSMFTTALEGTLVPLTTHPGAPAGVASQDLATAESMVDLLALDSQYNAEADARIYDEWSEEAKCIPEWSEEARFIPLLELSEYTSIREAASRNGDVQKTSPRAIKTTVHHANIPISPLIRPMNGAFLQGTHDITDSMIQKFGKEFPSEDMAFPSEDLMTPRKLARLMEPATASYSPSVNTTFGKMAGNLKCELDTTFDQPTTPAYGVPSTPLYTSPASAFTPVSVSNTKVLCPSPVLYEPIAGNNNDAPSEATNLKFFVEGLGKISAV